MSIVSKASLAEAITDEPFPLESTLRNYLHGYPHKSPQLLESSLYAVGSPGQRWRPMLFLAIYEALSGHPATVEIQAVACSIEYLHTASIVLDDLPAMDDAHSRRGGKSCHVQFSSAQSILTALYLCDVAEHWIHEFASPLSAPSDIEDLFRSAKSKMMLGQIEDLQAEKNSIKDLIETCRLKSGSLYALAASMPAYILGLTHIIDQLTAFGNCLGIAYQISDDIRDQVLDGADRRRNTIPRLYGIQTARDLLIQYKRESIQLLPTISGLRIILELVENICPTTKPLLYLHTDRTCGNV